MQENSKHGEVNTKWERIALLFIAGMALGAIGAVVLNEPPPPAVVEITEGAVFQNPSAIGMNTTPRTPDVSTYSYPEQTRDERRAIIYGCRERLTDIDGRLSCTGLEGGG